MVDAVDIIKKLILPILTYAAEVICPTQHTIDQINLFIASMICEVTHIPKHCTPLSVLWEVDVECFETILAKAKLRFYFKMINSKNNQLYKYLLPGNYLHEEIQSILGKLKSEHLTPEHMKIHFEQNILTKWGWKQLVKKMGREYNYNIIKQNNIQFSSMKPTHYICEWIEQIPKRYISSFYTARHNVWPHMECPCTQGPIVNVNLHIFSECSHAKLLCDQLALSQHIDEVLEQKNLGYLSQVTRIQILLGKHTLHLEKENMMGVYVLAAKLCHTASKLLIKLPS
jgi:hypothetical protein